MRVIAGFHRSRRLKEVPSDKTRETKDRVKESLFNSIQPQLADARVLDLFAGSGALGIEALSRGANRCDFNDLSHVAYDVAYYNVTNLDLSSRSRVMQYDAIELLDELEETYDVILLDPPYDSNLLGPSIETIAKRKLLASHGIIVCLHGKMNPLQELDCGIMEYKRKTIGITRLTYLKWGD